MDASEVLNLLEKRINERKIYNYKPFGHPDTLWPDGEMFKEHPEWVEWSNKPWQLDFHNASNNHERLLLCANGVGKCGTSASLIHTSDGIKRFSDIWGKPDIKVLTYPDSEPRKVTRWIRKPPEECFRITLSNGDWFECPKGHKILTAHGFSSLGDILKFLPGDGRELQDRPLPLGLFGRAHRFLQNARINVFRLKGILRGYWDRYFVDSRLYGGLLLSDEEGVQVFSPLQDDAQAHNGLLCNSGDVENKYTNILLRSYGHLSMNVCGVLHVLAQWIFSLIPKSLCGYQWCGDGIRNDQQSPDWSGPDRVNELTHRYQFSSSNTPILCANGADIISCSSIGAHTLYDMEVYERHNYIAGGMVHHNTIAGSAETAIHLTGDYPDWWEGHRFTKPPFFWIGSITNETQREITQAALLGPDLGEGLGTGYIPKEKIIGKPKTRQAGVSDVVDIVQVRHSSGGVAKAVFKVYEQGWRKWQGAAPDGIYLDEEPDDYRIFEECQTRVIRTNGIIYATLTPLLGETDLVRHFMDGGPGIWWSGATWDDVPHLNEERKNDLIRTYSGSSMETRTKGVPLMGAGKIFFTNEDDIKVNPFKIPDHFRRLKGIDFGSSHPCAVVDIAIDDDRQIVYVTRSWRRKTEDISEHCEAINEVNPWVPVAWPHDGVNHQKGGKQLKQYYLDHNVKLLSRSACYKNDTLGSQPVMPIIMQVNDMASSGQFKVFADCHDFFDEWRNYHYDNHGNPVKRRDDVLKACFYAVMMKRYASHKIGRAPSTPDSPMISMRI